MSIRRRLPMNNTFCQEDDISGDFYRDSDRVRKWVIGSPSTAYFYKIDDEKKRAAFIMFLCHQKVAAISRAIGISRKTVYIYVSEGFDIYPEFKADL